MDLSTNILEPSIKSKLELAKDIVNDQPDEALRICNEVLSEELDNQGGQMALFMIGYIMLEAQRYGLAYQIYQRCAQLNPRISEIWSNMGMCLEDSNPKKAKEFFQKAYKLDNKNWRALANEGLIDLTMGNPERCIELCERALKQNPDITAARHNKALAQLMLHDWGGWEGYYQTLGIKRREHRDYGVPDWEGQPGKVLVYGEQGVGDEILYASCLSDLMKTNDILIDTDRRLENLFRRSFDCEVWGTRFDRGTDIVNERFDYSISIGQLPYFYRRQGGYPGTPYLKADEERRLQWRSLFDTLPGKKIGIAWNGGLKDTGEKKRSLRVDDFEPFMGETLISLDYKETDDRLKCYREVMKGRDIDEMAPLIMELDYIVSCTTTVVHLAGALGVKCYCLVPSAPPWVFGKSGDMPWYNSVELIRQNKGEPWANVVKRLYASLSE